MDAVQMFHKGLLLFLVFLISKSSGREGLCGFTFYNDTDMICKDGKLSNITTTTAIVSPRSKTTTTTQMPQHLNEECLMTKEQRSSGYTCCGNGVYHPDFQTCCRLMAYNYQIHENMRDKDHVCCGLKPYRRSSKIPCAHPANNDRFGKPAKFRKTLIPLCPKYDFFAIISIRKTTKNGKETYIAKLRQRPLTGKAKVMPFKMPLPIDKYSRGISGKRFLLLTNLTTHDRQNELDFYLKENDRLFSFGGLSKKKIRKTMAKLLRACRRGRRNQKRRNRENMGMA